jgi:hypothetical protein
MDGVSRVLGDTMHMATMTGLQRMIGADWATDCGKEAARATVRSMFFEGKPTVRRFFVYNFADETPVGGRLSVAAAAAAA